MWVRPLIYLLCFTSDTSTENVVLLRDLIVFGLLSKCCVRQRSNIQGDSLRLSASSILQLKCVMYEVLDEQSVTDSGQSLI